MTIDLSFSTKYCADCASYCASLQRYRNGDPCLQTLAAEPWNALSRRQLTSLETSKTCKNKLWRVNAHVSDTPAQQVNPMNLFSRRLQGSGLQISKVNSHEMNLQHSDNCVASSRQTFSKIHRSGGMPVGKMILRALHCKTLRLQTLWPHRSPRPCRTLDCAVR